MTYFSIAAHNRELVVIDNMETFTHHFCYRTRQKKGEVVVEVGEIPEDHFSEVSPILGQDTGESDIQDDDIL